MNHRSLSLATLFGAAMLSLAGCAHKAIPVHQGPPPAPSPTVVHVASPLDGEQVLPALTKHRVAAVMIDNYPYDTRPQSGLRQADIVYEAEAEGGITRYMALFLENAPQKIGPVRSARLYFVDLARPYSPLFAHAGENDDVWEPLRELRADGFADMEEILQAGEAFWRDDSRYMPHNLYTSIDRLRKSAPNHGWRDMPFGGPEFSFVDPPQPRVDTPSTPMPSPAPAPLGLAARIRAALGMAPPVVPARGIGATPRAATHAVATPPPDALGVTLDFWRDYEVRYVYAGGAYLRYIGGVLQHDLDDPQPYRVTDVVAVWIPATVLDEVGDLRMNVYGRFPALAIRGGHATECAWVAPGPDKLPRLVDARGANVAMVPGQIYIEILPQGGRVRVGKQYWSH